MGLCVLLDNQKIVPGNWYNSSARRKSSNHFRNYDQILERILGFFNMLLANAYTDYLTTTKLKLLSTRLIVQTLLPATLYCSLM